MAAFTFLLLCAVALAEHARVPDRALPVCQNCTTKGYDIVSTGDGIFAFTDGGYWALAIVNQRHHGGESDHGLRGHDGTGNKYSGGSKECHGLNPECEPPQTEPATITLVDAWQGDGYLKAVADILKWTGTTTVKYLVYSHMHTDHIGNGAAVKAAYPQVKIIGQQEVKDTLLKVSTALRPLPDIVFEEEYRLPEAGLHLTHAPPGHSRGDLFIWHAASQTLMFVDVIFPRWIPFWNMAIAQDIPGFYAVHELVLKYDFKTFVGGHLTRLGDRADVVECYDFAKDLKATAEAIGPTLNFGATGFQIGAFDPAQRAYGNLWDVFDTMLTDGARQCEKQLIERWGDKLGGVDVWGFHQCWALLEALRVDF